MSSIDFRFAPWLMDSRASGLETVPKSSQSSSQPNLWWEIPPYVRTSHLLHTSSSLSWLATVRSLTKWIWPVVAWWNDTHYSDGEKGWDYLTKTTNLLAIYWQIPKVEIWNTYDVIMLTIHSGFLFLAQFCLSSCNWYWEYFKFLDNTFGLLSFGPNL